MGLVSFLLMLYYKNNKILNYSIRVIIINRLRDLIILFTLILFIDSLNLSIFNNFDVIEFFFFTLSLLLKRAQFPFNI